jgi:uncharacterized alpha-E superfamily protein
MTTGDHVEFDERYAGGTAEAVAWFLTFDPAYSNSILSALSKARDNARTVREVISREMWQELNEFYLMVKRQSREPFRLGEMGDFFRRVKLCGMHYEGVTNSTSSRGEAWSFARLGRLLERADKTSRILDVNYYLLQPSAASPAGTIDQVGWAALLNSASALQMYRQLYHTTSPANVARFLLQNRQFPRAIAYCVSEAQLSLHNITGTPLRYCSHESERLIGSLQASLAYASIEDVMQHGLHQYIDGLQRSLNDIGDAIQNSFFGYPSSKPAAAPLSTQTQAAIGAPPNSLASV